MKKSRMGSSWAILAAVAMLVGDRVGADIVYNNSTNDLFTRFNPGLAEVGDEIILAGTARTATLFAFQYWGVNFSGNEQAQVRFYANDGAAAPAGPTILMPNNVLFDSGLFDIVATPRSTLIFEDFITGAATPLTTALPDSFTWSVQFFGTDGAGESAGVDLYSPPTVGGNYLEYWDNGAGWQYSSLTIGGTNGPANFGAYIEAVPEPASIWLGLLGGLGILGLRCRKARR
jgi:hypothetical protein